MVKYYRITRDILLIPVSEIGGELTLAADFAFR